MLPPPVPLLLVVGWKNFRTPVAPRGTQVDDSEEAGVSSGDDAKVVEGFFEKATGALNVDTVVEARGASEGGGEQADVVPFEGVLRIGAAKRERDGTGRRGAPPPLPPKFVEG